jgi:hypothetical protein
MASERSEGGHPVNILIYMIYMDHPTYAKASVWQARDDDFLHTNTFHRHNERAQRV